MTRKLITAAAVAVLAVPTFAQAQDGSVAATATVPTHHAVTGTGDIAFGILSRDAANEVNAAGGTGSALRTVEFNHDVTVSFGTVPTVLTGSGTNTIAVTLRCAARQNATWGDTVDCGGSTFDLDVGTGLSTATLGFGGGISAAAAAGAVADSYSATLNIYVAARGT
jgi:hypothetical protein